MQNLLLITVSGLTAGAVILRLYCQRKWGTCTSSRSMDGKTVVITGANSGLGKVTAVELVKRGAKVILACRNENSANEAIQDIRRTCGHKCDVHFKKLDLCSFRSVERFVEEVSRDEKKLDVLISNAGIYGCPNSLTEDGFETQYQVNHLGHALLELLLIPKLKQSATSSEPARIVVVTSSLALNGVVQDLDFIKRHSPLENYKRTDCYRNSKLASLIFSQKLASKLVAKNLPITVLLASPGFVWTNLGRHVKRSKLFYILVAPIALFVMRTPWQGCQSILECVLSDKLKTKSGTVVRNCKEDPDFVPKKGNIKSFDVFKNTLDSIGLKSEDGIF